MTNYNLKPPTLLPSLAVMEKKAARKKLLEEVRKRRIQMAARRREKEQTAYNTNEEYREYQDMLKA
jgi:hypothetical protein